MKKFKSVMRLPDLAVVGTEKGWYDCKREGDSFVCGVCAVSFKKNGNAMSVILTPITDEPITRIKLRFNDDFDDIERVLVDAWAVGLGNLAWYPVMPETAMPWYFNAYDGERTHGYGVKTGCNSFCCFQLDSMGMTFWLDVRNGGDGIILKEPLLCAELCEREGELGESAFEACQKFCRIMCEKPALPERPIFGLNNWYYAYGNLTRESIMKDAELCGELGSEASVRPYMLVDDGWMKLHDPQYNGGPHIPSEKIGDMSTLADSINGFGAIPGIWFRPMLTKDELPEDCYHPAGTGFGGGKYLDITNQQSLDYIKESVERIVSWGYRMIKYDFTSPDFTGRTWLQHYQTAAGWHFKDRSKTNAQILMNLYRTIKEAAGKDVCLMGCNTYNHLSAGINHVQRSGSDTSGMTWEITRQLGINSLAMRLPQNKTFFLTDADCPAFTPAVSSEYNMRFLELACDSGISIFASVTPGHLTSEYVARAKAAFKRASENHTVEPIDWMSNSCPAKYMVDGKERTYDWFSLSDGANLFGELQFDRTKNK